MRSLRHGHDRRFAVAFCRVHVEVAPQIARGDETKCPRSAAVTSPRSSHSSGGTHAIPSAS